MMDFLTCLDKQPFIVLDGPMETRIEYGTNFKLDREMSIFTLLEKPEGRQALTKLYNEDIAIARHYDLPIITNPPIFRASPAHLKRLGYNSKEDIVKVNKNSIQFVKQIREQHNEFAEKIYITAPIGPKNAGFTSEDFTVKKAVAYHQPQVMAVAEEGVDVISAPAMPGASESIGLAKVMAETDLPYNVGFVIDKQANLLDGVPLVEVIGEIDAMLGKQKPDYYMIICVHATVCEQALQNYLPLYQRIKGIKANGSAKPPKELLKLNKPEADEPKVFADELMRLHDKYGFKILGGCCGTDSRHLESLAKLISEKE